METFLCKRRTGHLMEDKIDHDEWQDRGGDRCCSFCGSIHPEDVINKIEKHGFGIIGQTDKRYKFYVGVNCPNPIPKDEWGGGSKYYRHHDTDEFIKKWNELINKTKK